METATDVEMVIAARCGDRQALADLLSGHLPLIYNVVGRALAGHPDVDDVVQETMLRAVERLSELRDPSRFRAWLITIAIRQVRDRMRARHLTTQRQLPLQACAEAPDPGTDVAADALDQVTRHAERRSVLAATAWLSGEDREVLALWWQEINGELTRAEVAEALALSPQHAAVRIHRMKSQLTSAYTVLAAWRAQPRCPGLGTVGRGWDGGTSPLWRKRLVRHVLSCPRCLAAGRGLATPDRVLLGLAALSVPATLAAGVRAAVEGKTLAPVAFSAGHGLVSSLRDALSHKAAVAAAAVAVLAAGGITLAVHQTPAERPDDAVAVASPPNRGAGPPTATGAPTASPPPATPTPRPRQAATGVATADIFVAPNGRDDGDGSLAHPFATLNRAVAQVRPGQTIALRGGTYRLTRPVTITTSGTDGRRIVLSAYRGERPVLNATAVPVDKWAVTQRASFWTVQDLEVSGSRSHAWVCLSCAHTVFRRMSMHDNARSGLMLRDPGTVGNQVLDSDFFRNHDPADNGGSGVGLAVKFGSGAGNVIRGNRAFHNADDGFDVGRFDSPIVIERNWSYGNGQNRWNVPDWDSNGYGFTLGGPEPTPSARHRLRDNAAWGNQGHGFGTEANSAVLTLIGNTAFRNRLVGFDLAGATGVARDNLALDNGTPARVGSGVVASGNSWDGGRWTGAMLRSTDPAVAEGRRQPDGTLPPTDYLGTGGDLGADLSSS